MFRASLPQGVEIRPILESDVPALFLAVDRNRSHLREWLAWVDATQNLEDTRAFVHAAVDNNASSYAFTSLILNGSEPIGVISTHKIDWLNRRCEIGYWLGEAFLGRGIMTEACKALVGHLFNLCELHRVECLCATTNHKSCAIPLRLGFKWEATLRDALLVGGKYHDAHVWSVLRNEWRG